MFVVVVVCSTESPTSAYNYYIVAATMSQTSKRPGVMGISHPHSVLSQVLYYCVSVCKALPTAQSLM